MVSTSFLLSAEQGIAPTTSNALLQGITLANDGSDLEVRLRDCEDRVRILTQCTLGPGSC